MLNEAKSAQPLWGRVRRGAPFLAIAWLMLLVIRIQAAPGDTKWVFPAGGAINSAPAIGPGGWVIFGSTDKKVYAVDGRTGEKQWEFATGGTVDADPAIGLDGTVYIGSADGFFYALDGYTGAKKWSFSCLNPFVPYSLAAPAVGPDGTVYLGGGSGEVYALEGATGKPKWMTPTNSEIVRCTPALGANGTLYLATAKFKLTNGQPMYARGITALDAITGAQKWVFDINRVEGDPMNKMVHSPVIGADGTVYFCDPNAVFAINGATGKQLWSSLEYVLAPSFFASPALDGKGTLYVGNGWGLLGRFGGGIYALDAKTGQQKWQHETKYWTRSTPAVSADGTVYIGEDQGNFFALDAATGVRKWGMRAGGAIGAPTIGVDGTVYVTSQDGKLYALEGTAGLLAGVCSKYRGDARNSGSMLHAGSPKVMPFLTNQMVGVGFPFTLEAVAEGQAPLSYAWFYNGAPIAGATNSVLPFAAFDATNAGVYRVQVSNALGSADSGEIMLTPAAQIAVEVDGPGRVERTPSTALVPLGTEIELAAQPDAGRRFVGWSGDLQGTNPVVHLTVNQSLHLRAKFEGLPGQIKWSFSPVGDSYMNSVNIHGLQVDSAGAVYASFSSVRFAFVYALDGGTGVQKWATQPNLAVYDGYSLMLGPDDGLYAMGSEGNVASLARATGQTQWTYNFGWSMIGTSFGFDSDGTIFSGLTADNPNIPTGTVQSVDGVLGTLKHSFASPRGHILALGGGKLFINSGNSTGDNLYCLNPVDGSTNWVYRCPTNIYSGIYATNGELFLSLTDNQLVALNAADGSTLWNVPQGSTAGSLLQMGESIVCRSANAIQSRNRLTGAQVWEYTSPTAINTGLVLGAANSIYFGGADSRLHALDGVAGAPKWDSVTLPQSPVAIAVGPDGTLFTANTSYGMFTVSKVYAIEGDGPIVSSDTNAPAENLQLILPPAQAIDELSPLILTFSATGNITDTNALRYTLVSAPEGLTLDALTGQMSWTPAEKQGPSNYVVQVKLTDTNNPSASVVQSFIITVREVNHAPQLTTEPRVFTVESGQSLVFTNTATDPDLPANTLTFSLGANALDGAQWDAATGVLSWTAPEARKAQTNVFTITVSDNGTPSLSDTAQFTVVVTPAPAIMPAPLVQREGDTKWVFPAGGAINSAPAIGPGGWVIFGSADKKVYAVDGRTGEKQWEFATGGAVDADPAIGLDGTVYIGSADGFFYALDGYTGAKKWSLNCLSTNLEYSVATPAIGPDGTVYVGGATGILYALDGATGATKWSTPANSTIDRSVPVVGPNGMIYVAQAATGHPDPYGIPRRVISALNANTGDKIWEFDGGYTVGPGGENESLSLTISEDGAVYFCSAQSVCALDGATGKELKHWWLTQCYAAPAMDNQGTLFIGCFYGTSGRLYGNIYAFDAQTGNQKWQYPTEYLTHCTPAVSADGTVYIGQDDGHFFALDADSGVRKWGMRAGGTIGAPTIGVDGTVYVGSKDGKLYALKGTAGLLTGACSKYRFDARNSGSLLHAGAPVVMPFLTNQMVGVGLPYTLEAVAEGHAPLSYTWFYNGEPMVGATNSTLPFAVFNATNAGVYRVQVSNALGSADSGGITLTAAAQIAVEVDGPGKVERNPSGKFVPLGTEVVLTAQPDAGRRFVNWNGDLKATNPVVRLAAAQSIHLRANYGYLPGQIKWKVSLGGEGYSFGVSWKGLCVDSAGVVYASVWNNRFALVCALEGKTGAKKWAVCPGITGDSGYDIWLGRDDGLYAMGASGNAVSLAFATGLSQWDFNLGWNPLNGTSIGFDSDGTIYSAYATGYPIAPTGGVLVLDGVFGSWKRSFVAPVGRIVAAGDGSLYLASNSYTNDTLYALNALNGATNWIYPASSDIFSATLDGQGRLLVSAEGAQLVALSTADGSLLWKKSLGASANSVVPAGNQVIYKTGNRIQACDPLTGTASWEYTAKPNIISSLVKGLANRVYFGGADKKLHALDIATGQQTWESEVLPVSPYLLALGPDGTLYAVDGSYSSSAGNTIYAIEGDGPLASTNAPTKNLELSLSQAQSMDELSTLSLTFRASGNIADTNALRYSLASAPEGMTLDALTGRMTWTPTASQGPSNYVVQVKLTDTNNPSASVVQSFTIAVREVNHAPKLTTEPRFFTVESGQSLVLTNTALDTDWPANVLTFALETNVLEGVSFNTNTGVLNWTAPVVASTSTNVFAITVYDNATPKLSDTGLFTVVVVPPPPVLRFEQIQRTDAEVVTLTWATVYGARYQLQGAENLETPEWANLGEPITAQGATVTQIDTSATTTQRFYRVVKMLNP